VYPSALTASKIGSIKFNCSNDNIVLFNYKNTGHWPGAIQTFC